MAVSYDQNGERVLLWRDRPLTGAEVEEEIAKLVDMLEDDNDAFLAALVTAKRAEAKYRVEHARLVLTGSQTTEARRAAYAVYHSAELLEDRLVAEAVATAAAETCRIRRAELEGLRSLIASARAAEHG